MFLSSILIWISIFLLMLRLKWRRPRHFPPGPSPLPLLGNLLELNLQNPMKDLERLRKRYGNVFSIYLGSQLAVVINGLAASKEAMVTKSTEFAGRPADSLLTHLAKNGVFAEDYGPVWKKRRRFALMSLKTFGMGKQSMEQRIHGELQHTIETLESSIGKKVSPSQMFHTLAFNTLCLVLFGTRYNYDDSFIRVVTRGFHENTKIASGGWGLLYDSLPVIRGLPLPFRRAFRNSEEHRELVGRIISDHEGTREPGQPRDLVDCYLDDLEKKNSPESSKSTTETMAVLLDLLFAGSDTVSKTFLTGFLYLMNHPHIQERCQREIDLVLEVGCHASYEDRHRMPYVQAVIHEIQRVANIIPLIVYRTTTTDTQLMGYSVPKGTLVIQSLDSVLKDEGAWKVPHQFEPENFLNDHGEFVKPEAFMPFSAGARVCLGEGLARLELFLVFVTLLRRFKFIWPEEDGAPDYTPVFGVSTSPKPYHMKVELRESK
ncbi:cytochrome P450 2F2-like [Synchiropus splendidus]|uniref:cytochrome P450 2F2-like n=1 Tax=Synchiropus splendidus TaxID=270530 RepID=UPI00237DBECC|nr:cytochrome P450 2F2-like [Synchiropus splendidus]